MDWYEDKDGNQKWIQNQTSSTYQDNNGQTWTRTGESATFTFGDEVIVFGQNTDESGNQTLHSNIFVASPEIQQKDEKYSASVMMGALPVAGVISQLDSPIPGPGDAAGVVVLVGAAIYTGIDYIVWQFSKTARGNHRDDGLRDWSDQDIADALGGLTGKLPKEAKALKQRLTKEQKVRGNRNTQKKGTEKGTGTGRR